MKASRFNVMATADPGGAVLFNTLHGSLTALESTEVGEIERALRDPASASPQVRKSLAAQQHLVPDDSDELAVVSARRSAGIRDRHRLDVIVMTTMDCNLGCPYCYETRTDGSRMSAETERRLCAWLGREIPSSTLLMLQWFGGEPLFDTPLIGRVSRHARAVAEASGTAVALHATTNGYLLDGWRREELLESGVKDFQVTLDGPPNTHDKMRPTRAGRPSFERIFRNVSETVRADPDVAMTLRVNLNQTNIDRIGELLERFEPDVRPRLRLALEPIFGDDDVSATANIPPADLSTKLADLYDQAADLGYEVSAANAGLLTGRLTYCYAERERQHVIQYDGSIYKCTTSDFDEQSRLAVLAEDGTLASIEGRLEDWMAHGQQFPNRCQTCAYLPLCMGGCRKAQLASGDEACTLIPSNASYVLKQIALSGFPHSLLSTPTTKPSLQHG